jgi:hypothetical protein
VSEVTTREAARRRAISDELAGIGIKRGVIQQMARDGQLIEVKCETPKCYDRKGRKHFAKPPNADSPWSPTVDHYPVLKSQGGTKTVGNVRLAHKSCNSEDYAWRERITLMIRDQKSLADIAETLNRKNVKRPFGSGPWTPASVRWTYVMS